MHIRIIAAEIDAAHSVHVIETCGQIVLEEYIEQFTRPIRARVAVLFFVVRDYRYLDINPPSAIDNIVIVSRLLGSSCRAHDSHSGNRLRRSCGQTFRDRNAVQMRSGVQIHHILESVFHFATHICV
jgi:hypothetical protein